MSSAQELKGAIYGMGNPLLDISAVVPQETLDEWGVKLNNAILAEEKHVPLYAALVEKHKGSSVWIRDLTEEGIEPNPGHQCARCSVALDGIVFLRDDQLFCYELCWMEHLQQQPDPTLPRTTRSSRKRGTPSSSRETSPVEYIAGGATQNSIRVAQWAIQSPGATTYTGCVGADAFGAQLAKSASADGVNVLYQVNDSTPTGTCACLIKDGERSLIANLAAANKFTPEHLETPALKAAIADARVYYSSGFFLTVSPPAFQAVAAHANAAKKLVAVNLAAPFIPSFFSEPLLAAIKVADIVFGNESEAEAFAQQQKLDKADAETVAKYIAALPGNGNRPRIAVITQGSSQTVVAVNGEVTKFDVPVLEKAKIVDVNGAGDAFVGGYLAQLVRGKSIPDCVKAGHYCSRTILQVSGTALPDSKPDAAEIVA